MSIVIERFDKPTSCLSCPFNHSDCWCAITKGEIDRDDYSCDLPCPIKPLDTVLDKIRAEIKLLKDYDKEYAHKRTLEIIDKYKAERSE